MNYKRLVSLVCVILLIFGISGCSYGQQGPRIQAGEAVFDAYEKVVNLEQGWTENTQQAYYFTDQGSRLLPYSWFLALEQPDRQALFRSNENIDELRYLPSRPSQWNPDGLPVGFVKNTDQKGQEWMGFTCAACHTAQINYKGTGLRIDGGPTIADLEQFNVKIVEAMTQTYENDDKFNRFAVRILGEQADVAALSKLRSELKTQTQVLSDRNDINYDFPDRPHYGYGRVDAIGSIFNQIMVQFDDQPDNARVSNAPTSYPFLWGTHQSDIVQWPGFSPNGPLGFGALIRNGGEVLGVDGDIDIPTDKSKVGYQSSLEIKNLGRLEQWVAELRSPQWPATYLPAINTKMATQGQQHYNKYCLSCHQVIARKNEGLPYKAVLTPIKEVKTDSTELDNMKRLLTAGNYQDRKEFVLFGKKIGNLTTGLYPLVNAVVGGLLKQPGQTLAASNIEFSGGLGAENPEGGNSILSTLIKPFAAIKNFWTALQFSSVKVSLEGAKAEYYKARPLNGIWATAPYLHNGSVLNLYELLLPAAERSQQFYLGSREFDPTKVGYVSNSEGSGIKPFEFDTTLTGNSNQGHEYGVTELNDSQKKELLEYLKTL